MNNRRLGSLSATVAGTFVALASLLAGCSDATTSNESEEALEGTLQTAVVGSLELGRSHFEYFLEDEQGEWLRLDFAARPDLLEGPEGHEHLALSHGGLAGPVQLRVSGVRTGDQFEVRDAMLAPGQDSHAAQKTEALIAATPRKVAVILANFSNDTSQPITKAAALDMVFTGAQSSNAYFKEMSFGIRSLVGKVAPAGDVYGWYTIAASSTSCDYSGWGNLARAAAQQAGVNLTGYDHVIHYFPRSATCGWSGVGQVPGKYTWINGSGAQTIAHELGHNYGSHHAASLTCTSGGSRVPISTTCTSSEYGNPFDVMGRGYRHMTAFNKGRVGFLEPENTLTVTADGTFTVAPLEFKSTQAQALRIPINTTKAYYVEFRQPSTFDNFSTTSAVVNGVLITRAPVAYGTLAMPELLDMVPSTTSFNDAALGVGKTFTDAASGISIRLNSISSAGATVVVDRP